MDIAPDDTYTCEQPLSCGKWGEDWMGWVLISCGKCGGDTETETPEDKAFPF